MRTDRLPSKQELESLLRYEPDSGRLFWLARNSPSWDARFAGREAIYARHSAGYRAGALLGRQVFAHRVIWKMIHDHEPAVIDHIDGDRSNNTLTNLRAATQRQNMRNRARHKTNKSGVVGVYWNKPARKWLAQFRSEGATVSRSFERLDDARAWRTSMALAAGYSDRHCRA